MPVRTDTLEEDGKLVLLRSQNVQFILDDNQRIAQETQHHRGDMRLAGRIPFVVAEQWSRECGEAIGTKAFAAYVKTKLMDGDFAKLRVRGF